MKTEYFNFYKNKDYILYVPYVLATDEEDKKHVFICRDIFLEGWTLSELIKNDDEKIQSKMMGLARHLIQDEDFEDLIKEKIHPELINSQFNNHLDSRKEEIWNKLIDLKIVVEKNKKYALREDFDNLEMLNFSHSQEESYRRGYTHGVLAASNGITLEKAYEWRNDEFTRNPPGTPGFGTDM